MSERMTDADWTRLVASTGHFGNGTAIGMFREEAHRARRVEQEQATTIKALADALSSLGFEDLEGGWHTDECRTSDDCTPKCVAASTALRLAGRLP